ncbi:MAG TPA: exodeoxyribonuclease VII large subunit, partial [Chthoniobacterales bacterium]
RFLSERTLARELMQRMRDAQQQLDFTAESLHRRLKQFVVDARAVLATHAQSLKSHDPKREVALCRNSIIELQRRLGAQPPQLLQNARQRFDRVEGMLRVLGPDATLRRGYSITTDKAGNVIHTVSAVRPKSKIRTRVADGEFESEVTEQTAL